MSWKKKKKKIERRNHGSFLCDIFGWGWHHYLHFLKQTNQYKQKGNKQQREKLSLEAKPQETRWIFFVKGSTDIFKNESFYGWVIKETKY